MGKLFFLLKIIFFSALVFAFLQIKIGEITVEERLLRAGHFDFVSRLVERIELKALSFTQKQNKKTGSRIDSFLEKRIEKLQTKSKSQKVKNPPE